MEAHRHETAPPGRRSIPSGRPGRGDAAGRHPARGSRPHVEGGTAMSQQPAPAVSVIVCTYNRPDTLHRAIESVLAQDHRDFEVIVVDDGSDPPAEPLPHQ